MRWTLSTGAPLDFTFCGAAPCPCVLAYHCNRLSLQHRRQNQPIACPAVSVWASCRLSRRLRHGRRMQERHTHTHYLHRQSNSYQPFNMIATTSCAPGHHTESCFCAAGQVAVHAPDDDSKLLTPSSHNLTPAHAFKDMQPHQQLLISLFCVGWGADTMRQRALPAAKTEQAFVARPSRNLLFSARPSFCRW